MGYVIPLLTWFRSGRFWIEALCVLDELFAALRARQVFI